MPLDLLAIGLLLAAPGLGGECPEPSARAQRPSDVDPGLWVSHAECLTKSGARKRASESAIRAAMFGSRKTRLEAYAVLARLEVDLLKGKASGPSDCLTIPSSTDSCLQPVWACGYSIASTATGVPVQTFGVAFCPTRERAASGDWSAKNRLLDPSLPPCAVIEFNPGTEARCSPAVAYGHDVPDGGACSDAKDGVACESAVFQCKQDPHNRRLDRCTVVYADACRMRVGAVCDGRAIEFPPEAPAATSKG